MDKKDVKEAAEVYRKVITGKAPMEALRPEHRKLTESGRSELEKRKNDICEKVTKG